jgi:hypothetical protein
MKNPLTGVDTNPNDWTIKICDYGLARSLAGVTSAKIIEDAMRGLTPRKVRESAEIEMVDTSTEP